MSAPTRPEAERAPCIACGLPVPGPHCLACGCAQTPGGLRVLQVLAQNTGGRVYLAAAAGGRRIVIKERVFAASASAHAVDAFEREARTLEQLQHAGVPRFLDAFTEGEGAALRLYLVEEHVPGEPLDRYMAHHRFDEQEARDIARQVLEVLEYLHSRTPPVLHRDLKPANLVRRTDGTIVVVDFGAARTLTAGRTVHDATLVGTPGYMAPELMGGTVSVRSDLFALGATLFHLLSRQGPEELLRPMAPRRWERTLTASPRFVAFLRRLVAPRAELRFATAAEARAFLEAAERRVPWTRILVGTALIALAAAGVSITAAPLHEGRSNEATGPVAQSSASIEGAGAAASPPLRVPQPSSTARLQARWRFDEPLGGATSADEGGQDVRLAVSGGERAPGGGGGAWSLRGRDTLVLSSAFEALGMREEGAVGFWVASPRYVTSPLLRLDGGDAPVLRIRAEGGGAIAFEDDGGTWTGLRRDAPAPGLYSHVMVAWGPDGVRLWSDGVLGATRSGWKLGPRGLSLGWDSRYPYVRVPAVWIDDLRLYSGRISDEDVRAIVEEASRPPPQPDEEDALERERVAVLRVHSLRPGSDLRFSLRGSAPMFESCRRERFAVERAEYYARRVEPGNHPPDGADLETHFDLYFRATELQRDCLMRLGLALALPDGERVQLGPPIVAPGDPTGATLLFRIKAPLSMRRGYLNVGESPPAASFEVDLDAEVIRRLTYVTGRILLPNRAPPAGQVRLRVEGGRTTATQTGGPFQLFLPHGPARLHAEQGWREKGPVQLEVPEGEVATVPDIILGEPPITAGRIGIRMKASEGMVIVDDLWLSGPAYLAGLRAGDVLVSADGHPLGTLAQVVEHVGGKPGTAVSLIIRRGGRLRTLHVRRAP